MNHLIDLLAIAILASLVTNCARRHPERSATVVIWIVNVGAALLVLFIWMLSQAPPRL